jgi:hypothetical protein
VVTVSLHGMVANGTFETHPHHPKFCVNGIEKRTTSDTRFLNLKKY